MAGETDRSVAARSAAGKSAAGKSGAKKPELQESLTYEAAMAELERIVADMEAGKLSLEDSLVAYKRGAELLSFCRELLEDVQQQVSVLENGVLKDFSGSPEAES